MRRYFHRSCLAGMHRCNLECTIVNWNSCALWGNLAPFGVTKKSHCNTLQHTATHLSVSHIYKCRHGNTRKHTATHCNFSITRWVRPDRIMYLLSTESAQDISGKVCTCRWRKLPTRALYSLTSFSSWIATAFASSLTISSAFGGNGVGSGLHCSMLHFWRILSM